MNGSTTGNMEDAQVLGASLKQREDLKTRLGKLKSLAARGLPKMFDHESQLFCFRLKLIDGRLMREGVSIRYTIISLLGLHEMDKQGIRPIMNIKAVFQSLLERKKLVNSIGDLGLMLWLCSLVSPENLDEVYSGMNLRTALILYRDAREGRTMELSWFLAGLSHAALALERELKGMTDLANDTYNLLKKNYGGKGIFGHLRGNTLRGAFRGRIGSFADQVYPIYALSRFAQAFSSDEAIRMALECGENICRLQGPLGQWWWHYESSAGRVVGNYPVYAVHQDGMAPMALFALSEVSGEDFKQHIYNGLQWIFGDNELGLDMTVLSHDVIWRSLFRKKYKLYFDEMFSLIKSNRRRTEPNDLIINFECRPYHLGWLLYAFAGKL